MKFPILPPIETQIPKDTLEPQVLIYTIKMALNQQISVDAAKLFLTTMDEEDRAEMLRGAKELALAHALTHPSMEL